MSGTRRPSAGGPTRSRTVRRWIARTAVAYLAAWGLTATLGVRGARAACEREHDVVAAWSGSSPAPFVVRARHTGFCSERAEAYAWVLGWTRRVGSRTVRSWYPIF